MRISTFHQSRTLSSQVQNAQSLMAEAQRKALTGKRYERASQDPVGSGQVLQTTRLKDRLDGMAKNLSLGKEHLGLVEGALEEVTTLLNQAKQLGLQANNATLSADQKVAISTQIDSIADRLKNLANSTDSEGLGLFSGQSRKKDAFQIDQATGALTFSGDDLPRQMELRPGEWTRMNLEGAGDFFKGIHQDLMTLRDSVGTGTATDALASIESRQKQTLDQRSVIGVRLQQVDKQQGIHSARVDDLTKQISDLQEVDLAEAFTEYQRANLVYTSALQFTAKAQEIGLMDFLR